MNNVTFNEKKKKVERLESGNEMANLKDNSKMQTHIKSPKYNLFDFVSIKTKQWFDHYGMSLEFTVHMH